MTAVGREDGRAAGVAVEEQLGIPRRLIGVTLLETPSCLMDR